MSQELRCRLAARDLLDPQPHSEDDVPAPLQIRRFSQGLESAVLAYMRRPYPGRFSRGAERLPEDDLTKTHIGRYSDGLDHAPFTFHVGRFSLGQDHSEV